MEFIRCAVKPVPLGMGSVRNIQEGLDILYRIDSSCNEITKHLNGLQFDFGSGICHLPCHNIAFHVNEIQHHISRMRENILIKRDMYE